MPCHVFWHLICLCQNMSHATLRQYEFYILFNNKHKIPVWKYNYYISNGEI